MSTNNDDSVEALQHTLQNAFAVLGRRPVTVASIGEDRKYEQMILGLEEALREAKLEIKQVRGLLKDSSDRVNKLLETVSQLNSQVAKQDERLRLNALKLQENHDTIKLGQQTISDINGQVLSLQLTMKTQTDQHLKLQGKLEHTEEMLSKANQSAWAQSELHLSTSLDAQSFIKSLEKTVDSQQAMIHEEVEKNMALKVNNDSIQVSKEKHISLVNALHLKTYDHFRRKELFLLWVMSVHQRRVEILSSKNKEIDSHNTELSTKLQESNTTLRTKTEILRQIEIKKLTAVSVGCSAKPITVDKSTSAEDQKRNREDGLKMIRGSTQELDEIARLRWEMDCLQRKLADDSKEKSLIINFLETEVQRSVDEIHREKRINKGLEEARSKLLSELSLTKAVMEKQSESIVTLGKERQDSENAVHIKYQSQIISASQSIQKTLTTACQKILQANSTNNLKRYFELWREYRRRRHTASSSAQTSEPVVLAQDVVRTLSSFNTKSTKSRCFLKWKLKSQTSKTAKLAQLLKREYVTLSSQTEPLSDEKEIDLRVKMIQVAHKIEVAGLQHPQSNEYAVNRAQILSLTRDVESTSFLLSQAHTKIEVFQEGAVQLKRGLEQSNATNQLLANQNQSLRQEIENLRKEAIHY